MQPKSIVAPLLERLECQKKLVIPIIAKQPARITDRKGCDPAMSVATSVKIGVDELELCGKIRDDQL